ncbi:MAG: hypothetical protein F4114_14135 [Rhodospirillaceae bacterium]|nr:hypothetical protein [Rhodospirillaceae bacterium]MYB15082.1 hypothetical protein [Rhodospirillaceae bacterium]MYI50208.1 hypothetical protein [Rhodospirillaceae bacterium]
MAQAAKMAVTVDPEPERAGEKHAFRFFDNREKYLMFVTTCSEKWEVAQRVGREIPFLKPTPPALNLFDAGVGDGTVLTRVMRNLHRQFPAIPFCVVGKEISMEDVRLTLEKLPDRFQEHPQLVVVMTNLYYAESPWLRVNRPETKPAVKRWNIALEGSTAHEFDEQVRNLGPVLAEGWQTKTSEKTGNPLYVQPSILVLYRKDRAFALDGVIPPPGGAPAGYDLVIASQPYRARLSAEIKVRNVLGPLARALSPGGRMIVIQSTGKDPGMELINAVWEEEFPFVTPRRDLIAAMKEALDRSHNDLNYDALRDDESLFRYELHALPDEIGESIGTSTLLAAWNAATYVAQIEDDRMVDVLRDGDYLEAARDVLKRHGGLWFEDESFLVTRGFA